MGDEDRYTELPPQVALEDTIEEVDHYEAVEPIRGVRRVSPYSPVAGIDEARLYAELGTDPRVGPWRRRAARATAYVLLAGFVLTIMARR